MHPLKAPDGAWTFARNIVTTNQFKTIENEKGFLQIGDVVFDEQLIIGVIPLDDGRQVIYSVHIGQYDNSVVELPPQIGILYEDTYTTLIADFCLNFRHNKHILGNYRKLRECNDVEVAWTDNYNQPRYLNIDDLPFVLDGNYAFIDVADCEILNLYGSVDVPSMNTIDVRDTGGVLLTGIYQFMFQYIRADGSTSDWLGPTDYISIIKDPSTDVLDTIDGIDAGTSTTKSIAFTLNNVDTTFVKLSIAAISIIDGITDVNVFRTYPITSATTTINGFYTGKEELRSLDIAELLSLHNRYIRASAITVLNDRLYLANLELAPEFDIQPYINNAEMFWSMEESIDLRNHDTSHKDPNNIYLNKFFMPGEVYAFYVAPVYKNGTIGKALHVPGRAPGNTSFTLAVGSETDLITDFIANNPAYQVLLEQDTTVNPDVKMFHTRDNFTLDGGGTSGTMSYWENDSEFYPDEDCWDIKDENDVVVGALRDEKIRHHKIPCLNSIGLVAGWAVGGGVFKGVKVGVRNLYLPPEVEEHIQGFKIYYAQRNSNNSAVLGMDNFMFGAQNESGTGTIGDLMQSGINGNLWSGVGSSLRSIRRDYVRSHCWDLLKNKPSGGDWISLQVECRVDIVGHRLNQDGDPGYKSVFINNIDGTSISWSYVDTSYQGLYHVRKINTPIYIPTNIDDTVGQDNRGNEEVWQAEIDYSAYTIGTLDTAVAITSTANYTYPNFPLQLMNWNYFLTNSFGNSATNSSTTSTSTLHYSYLYNINRFLYDAYTDYDSQILVDTGIIVTSANKIGSFYESPVLPGDVFLVAYGVKKTTPINLIVDPMVPLSTIWHYPVFSAANINYRQVGATLPEEDYYPTLENGSLEDFFKADPAYGEYRELNPDYNRLNILIQPEIQKDCYHCVEGILVRQLYPNRIIRSKEGNSDATGQNNWRDFPPLDYYDNAYERAEIVDIQGANGRLIISHKLGTFITLGNERLQTDSGSAYIGSGDIFSNQPDELIPDDTGYAGNQSPLASIFFKGKYFWVDRELGKCYIVQNEINEVSNRGIHNFLEANLPSKLKAQMEFVLGRELEGWEEPQSPINGGLSAVYDENYDRIILVNRDYEFINIANFKGIFDSGGTYALDEYTLQNGGLYRYNGSSWDHVNFDTDDGITDAGWTLSYSTQFDYWVCMHDYSPYFLWKTRTSLMCSKQQVFKMNVGPFGSYFDVTWPSFIDMIFSLGSEVDVILRAVKWHSEFFDLNTPNKALMSKTLSHIAVFNSYQSTGLLPIIYDNNLTRVQTSNTRRDKEIFSFNKVRDILASSNSQIITNDRFADFISVNHNTSLPFFNKNWLVGRYFIIRYYYDNLDNKHMRLLDADIEIKPTNIKNNGRR